MCTKQKKTVTSYSLKLPLRKPPASDKAIFFVLVKQECNKFLFVNQSVGKLLAVFLYKS